jgi:putative DNA primase/helicase
LKDKLAAELPGILNWCIEGTQQWLASGLNPPASCLVATDEFRRASDSLSDFIADHFTPDPEGYCTKGEVFTAYQRWANQQGIARPMSKRGLGIQLANRGWQEFKHGHEKAHCWAGFRINHQFEE